MLKKIIIILLLIVLLLGITNIYNKVEASTQYDYIVIGDSGISGIYEAITGSGALYGNGSQSQARQIDNKNYYFLAEVGGDYEVIDNNYQSITNALNNAKSNAKCLVWLGSNGLDYDAYPGRMNKLASNFPNVKFYFISSTAINEPLYRKNYPQYADSYNNNAIKDFNKKVLNGTNSFKGLKDQSRYLKNLFFLDIQYANLKIDNQTKSLYNWVTDNTKYVSEVNDGLHYDSKLNYAIWYQAMMIFGDNSGTIPLPNLSIQGVNNTTSGGSTTPGGSTTGGSNQPTMANIDSERIAHDYKDVLGDTDYYSDVGNISSESKEKVGTKIGKILKIVTNIGIITSLLMLAVLGIKYMLGSQVEVKRDIIPYLVGCFLIFSICLIIKILQNLGNIIV